MSDIISVKKHHDASGNLEYRELVNIAKHLGFCENCWNAYHVDTVTTKG